MGTGMKKFQLGILRVLSWVLGFTPLSICPSAAFAYVNQSASGSKSYVAALMLAHASAKQVNLFVEADANGYCRIIEFAVGP